MTKANLKKSLLDQTSHYQTAGLLRSLAALQLVPGNASHLLVLEGLSRVVAGSPPSGSPKEIPRNTLQTLCNSEAIKAAIAHRKDPFEGIFAETFPFFDGPYEILPGLTPEAPYKLRQLASGIFYGGLAESHAAYAKDASNIIKAGLAMSTAVALRAGLDRRSRGPSITEQITVPSREELPRLKAAVSFQAAEVAQIMRVHNLPLDALTPLTTKLGSNPAVKLFAEEGLLDKRPFVELPTGEVIVATPCTLLSSIIHFLLQSSVHGGVSSALASCYNQAVWRQINHDLGLMGLTPSGRNLGEIASDYHQDDLFELDTDKLLHVQLMTDDLENLSTNVYSPWTKEDISEALAERMLFVEQELAMASDGNNEILHISLVDSPSRSFFFGVRNHVGTVSPHLAITPSDLETLGLYEGGKSLALWQYAAASGRLRDNSRVMSMDFLDEFDVFRRNNYSYYMSDDETPTHILFMPGGAGEFRRDTQAKYDKHIVARPDGRGLTEVISAEEPWIPIYLPSDVGTNVARLVEGLPCNVWLIASSDALAPSVRATYQQLVECLAYWVWQLAEVLREPLQGLETRFPFIRLNIHLANPSAWSEIAEKPAPTGPTSNEIASYEIESESPSITIFDSAVGLFARDDNMAERELVRVVLKCLNEFLLGNEGGTFAGWQNSEIDDIVDFYVPLGHKRKIQFIDWSRHVDADPTGLPPSRNVQHVESDIVLDDVGRFVQEQLHFSFGPIPDDKRVHVLNNVVEYLYQTLAQEVASYDGDGLLEWLTEQGESLVRNTAHRRLTLRSTLECYGRIQEYTEKMEREGPELNTALIASRFLIEYVAVVPPSGIRPVSLTGYDRLMAIAAGLVNWALESDLVKFEISDIKFTVLPSGRLGADRTGYLRGRGAYLSDHVQSEIVRASNGSQFVGQGDDEEILEAEKERANGAFLAEFGFSLVDLIDFLSGVILVGAKQPDQVKSTPEATLIAEVAEELNWTPEAVAKALSLFTLEPRNDYLVPPPSFRAEDVYPWRFNRALSLVRRPIILRPSPSGREAIWGNRTVFSAQGNLLNLFLSGRLKAVSQPLQAEISRRRNRVSEQFNNAVADELEREQRLIVRRRVHKINGNVLGYPDNLGDVDVLVVEPDNRIILLLECKDLGVARTPFELKSEIQNLILGSRGNDSMMDKHRRRTEWVRVNQDLLLGDLGIATEEPWEVSDAIIVDEELLTPYLLDTKMPVLTLRQLRLGVLGLISRD